MTRKTYTNRRGETVTRCYIVANLTPDQADRLDHAIHGEHGPDIIESHILGSLLVDALPRLEAMRRTLDEQALPSDPSATDRRPTYHLTA